MVSFKDGGLMAHASVLDGSNYGFWKVMMSLFMRSLDEVAWTSLVVGWALQLMTKEY